MHQIIPEKDVLLHRSWIFVVEIGAQIGHLAILTKSVGNVSSLRKQTRMQDMHGVMGRTEDTGRRNNGKEVGKDIQQ